MTASSKRMKPYSAAKTLVFLVQEVPDVHTDDGRLVPTEAAITYTRYEDGHRVTTARVTGVMRNGELDLTDTLADLNYSDGPNDDWPEWLETLAMDDQWNHDYTTPALSTPGSVVIADGMRISTAPARPDEVTLHLPEWSYWDTQAYSADLGIPAGHLPALKVVVDAWLAQQAVDSAEAGAETTP